MQSRRKMIIIAASVFIGLLFVGAVALLVQGFIKYSAVQSELTGSHERLQSLYERNPFPSQQNYKLEKENLATISQSLGDLLSEMASGQVEPLGQSPAVFINQFFETQKQLLADARAAGVSVPKGFDFGFGRHMPGNLPAPQDVPRLTQQLHIVEGLCKILYLSRVSAIEGIARQEFEVDVPGTATAKVSQPVAPGRRGQEIEIKNVADATAGIIPVGQQYGRWHFILQFSGHEAAIMNVLNGLAKSPVFTVVTRLDLDGDEKLFERREVAVAAKGGDDALAVKEPPKAKDYRVVCGREGVLNMKLELDVYQFAKVAAEPARKPGGAK